LFGVLMVNLLDFFRVSLFTHILTFHTDPGRANRVVDVLSAALLEFKAFHLFSFAFGIGVAIQTERATAKRIGARRFLFRRFLILLGLGLFHLFFIANVDILTLYAVCGLLLLPVLRLRASGLAILGVIFVASLFPTGAMLPSADFIRAHAAEATRVYQQGSFLEIFRFRCHETLQYIVPLVIMSIQKTLGLMLLGMAAWRTNVLQEPKNHRRLLWSLVFCAGAIGGLATILGVFGGLTSYALAMAYGAAMFLWSSYPRFQRAAAPIAATGQMALTNYLAQSLILSFLFYGYGLGMFGRINSGPAAMIGVALYVGQLVFSSAWLRRYRFGPAEWFWRSLTYGSWQPFRRQPI
jgi:uncharacterized protein